MNSDSLQRINLSHSILDPEDFIAIARCSNLKHVAFCGCLPPSYDFGSMGQTLTNLEIFELSDLPCSRSTTETLSRCCQSLYSLLLDCLLDFRDAELLILVEGCPSLRSLRLSSLSITDESVRMLISRHPRRALDISGCGRVSWETRFSFLREFTIPQILNDQDPEFQIISMLTLRNIVSHHSDFSSHQVRELLEIDLLVERLVGLLATPIPDRLRGFIIQFFFYAAVRGYHRVLANAGALSTVVCSVLQNKEIDESLDFLLMYLSSSVKRRLLLQSGVLSLYCSQVRLLSGLSISLHLTLPCLHLPSFRNLFCPLLPVR
jgi:hypothetical protein